MTRTLQRACALLFALAAACGDDTATPGRQADAAATEDAGALDAGRPLSAVGTFSIELIEAVPATDQTNATPAVTSFAGLVYESERLSNMQWTLVDEADDCELLEPLTPFCDPSCTSRQVCAPEGECVAVPATIDFGPAAVQGLSNEDGSDAAVTLTPRATSSIYFASGAGELAYPPFEAGSPVTLSFTPGGGLAPFELHAEGIAPLELLTHAPLSLDPEGPTLVRWTPASAGASRIVVRVDISHHGGQKGELVCDTADDGELELPPGLVQGLIDLGVAGFPSLAIAREARSEPPPFAPGLRLKVFSSLTLALEIPGVLSCTMPGEQAECPDGQSCLTTRICQ